MMVTVQITPFDFNMEALAAMVIYVGTDALATNRINAERHKAFWERKCVFLSSHWAGFPSVR